jgi:hypothetical protein
MKTGFTPPVVPPSIRNTKCGSKCLNKSLSAISESMPLLAFLLIPKERLGEFFGHLDGLADVRHEILFQRGLGDAIPPHGRGNTVAIER